MRSASIPLVQSFRLAVRFALWLPADTSPFPVRHWLLEQLGLLLLALTFLGQWLTARHYDPFIDPVGLTATIGFIAVPGLLVSLLSPATGRGQMLAIFLWLLIFWKIICITTHSLQGLAERHSTDSDASTISHYADLLITFGIPVWCMGALIQAFEWISGYALGRASLRAGAAGIMVGVLGVLLPDSWLFATHTRTGLEGTIWARPAKTMMATTEGVVPPQHKALAPRKTRIELKQAELLNRALDELKPRVARRPNVFLLGIAGDMKADVLPREVEGGLSILSERLGGVGHSLMLSNHLDTTDDYPIASRQNIAAAIAGIGRHMDLATDLLVVMISSHGAKSGAILDMGDFAEGTLAPEDLRAALDRAGVRNRLIIISACYSGVYLPALRNDHTAVLTATAADRTSFNCTAEDKWTYFGDALFQAGFGAHADVPQAFYAARRWVEQKESSDWLPNSYPQLEIGSALPSLFPAIFPAARIERTMSANPPGTLAR